MIVKSPPVSNDFEAFYYIIDHLKKQDCKAIIPLTRSGCRYRVEEYRSVLKCAVGALISVHVYAPHLEDQTVQFDGEVYDALRDSNPDWRITENSIEMLQSLQRLHDEVEVRDWSWFFGVIDQAIEEFGFENVVYSKKHSRSALYLMVSMAQDHIRSLSDTRLVDWNSSEVTMDWFSNKRAKATVIA